MRRLGRVVDAVLVPKRIVLVRSVAVLFLQTVPASRARGYLGHGLERNDALDGQVGLVGQLAREIVRRELVRGYLGVVNQVARPAGEQGPVVRQPLVVAAALRVGEHHDDHVAALLQGHGLVVARVVAQRARVPAEVVHRPRVGVAAALLVLEQRVERPPDEVRVQVHHGREGGEDDVDGLDVAVGANLLHKHLDLVPGAHDLDRAVELAERERGDGGVVVAGGPFRVGGNAIVDEGRHLAGVAVVVVEELHELGVGFDVVFPEGGEALDVTGAVELDTFILGDANGEEC